MANKLESRLLEGSVKEFDKLLKRLLKLIFCEILLPRISCRHAGHSGDVSNQLNSPTSVKTCLQCLICMTESVGLNSSMVMGQMA